MNSFRQLPRGMKLAFAAAVVIAVVFIIWTIVLSSRLRAFENPQAASSAEIQRLVRDVGRFMVLPADEVPSLATVSDPDKLKDQAFFARAEVGDKVLIYSTSRKAVLWRPSISKIIEVSALNISAPQAPAPAKK